MTYKQALKIYGAVKQLIKTYPKRKTAITPKQNGKNCRFKAV